MSHPVEIVERREPQSTFIEYGDYPGVANLVILVPLTILAVVLVVIGLATFGQCNGNFALVWFGLTAIVFGLITALFGGFRLLGFSVILALILIAIGVANIHTGGCSVTI